MATPYPVGVLWPSRPRDLRSVALPLLKGLGEQPMIVGAALEDGEHRFATPAAAARFLGVSPLLLNGLSVELGAGFPIQSIAATPGQFEHVGIDLLFHLYPADAERLERQSRAFATALIEQAGAWAVWFGSARGDNGAVFEAVDDFAEAMRARAGSDPLPLAKLAHVSWLMLWSTAPGAPRVDVEATLAPEGVITGTSARSSAPWAGRVIEG